VFSGETRGRAGAAETVEGRQNGEGGTQRLRQGRGQSWREPVMEVDAPDLEALKGT